MSSLIQEAASRLGLAYSVKLIPLPSPVAEGKLEGQQVSCAWNERGSRVEARFDPPLDLGLAIRSRGFANLPSLGQRVHLGDSNWDDEVIATADDAERAAVLFAADARRGLLGLNATTAHLEVTDERVVADVSLPDVESIVQALTHAARLASFVAAARLTVPVAAPLRAHAAALRAFAGEHRLQLEQSPLTLWGERTGVRLSAQFVRIGRNAFDVEVRVEPAEASDGFGLRVRRESTLDRVKTLFGGQDILTGDAVFDPMFLVRAEDEARAKGGLGGDVRALLLELARRFEVVSLDDASLVARSPVGRVPAAELVSLLEAACTVTELVGRAAADVSRGPYR
jgi:hypothetical protein